MGRRKKTVSHWPPPGWDISYEYEVCGATITTRKFDIKVRTTPKTTAWWKFDYFCHNTNNGKTWVSGFDASGFAACRVSQIEAVRLHREKKTATNVREEIPIKKQRKRRSDAGKKRGPRKLSASRS